MQPHRRLRTAITASGIWLRRRSQRKDPFLPHSSTQRSRVLSLGRKIRSDARSCLRNQSRGGGTDTLATGRAQSRGGRQERARRTSEGGALSSPTAESARPHRPTLLGSFKSAVHQVLTRAMSKSRNGRISSFSWTAGRPPLWWAPTKSKLSRPRSRIRTASINGGRQRHPA